MSVSLAQRKSWGFYLRLEEKVGWPDFAFVTKIQIKMIISHFGTHCCWWMVWASGWDRNRNPVVGIRTLVKKNKKNRLPAIPRSLVVWPRDRQFQDSTRKGLCDFHWRTTRPRRYFHPRYSVFPSMPHVWSLLLRRKKGRKKKLCSNKICDKQLTVVLSLKSAGVWVNVLSLKSAEVWVNLLSLKGAGVWVNLPSLKSAGVWVNLLSLKSAGV